MNLFSINYVHMGAPKHWYATSPHRADRVESLAQGQWPLLHRECSEFLRHKNTMIAPTIFMRESSKYLRRLIDPSSQAILPVACA